MIVLPPYGKIDLESWCAHDRDVVESARISTSREGTSIRLPREAEPDLAEDEIGLINYLMKGKHGSPFEHNYFKWRIRMPIFVAREWVRHRIGVSWNEESSRYSELKPNFYVPALSDIRTQVGKPGAYVFEKFPDAEARDVAHAIINSSERAFEIYRELLDKGVAKEVARVHLPVNTYTNVMWSANARSIMNFLELRTAPTAQLEIRKYAIELERQFADIMPITHAAFVANGREAP